MIHLNRVQYTNLESVASDLMSVLSKMRRENKTDEEINNYLELQRQIMLTKVIVYNKKQYFCSRITCLQDGLSFSEAQ